MIRVPEWLVTGELYQATSLSRVGCSRAEIPMIVGIDKTCRRVTSFFSKIAVGALRREVCTQKACTEAMMRGRRSCNDLIVCVLFGMILVVMVVSKHKLCGKTLCVSLDPRLGF
jgi:hypothetical protein